MISEQITIGNVTNDVLKEKLVSDLSARYIAELHSTSAHTIEIGVSGGSKETTVQVKGTKHTPTLVTLKVDHKHRISVGKYNRHMKNRRGGDNSGYRLYFYFFIVSLLSSAVYVMLDTFLPGREAKIRFFIFLISAVVIFFLLRKPISKLKERNLNEFDLQVFQQVKSALLDLNPEGETLKKCWQCFEELIGKSNHCEHCGAALT